MNHEILDVQAGFRKGRGTRDQVANTSWIIEKARKFQKNIYFCCIDYAKACVDHNKLWKILKEMGIPEHLTCLLRNLYAGQEATVRTGHGRTDWFQIGKALSFTISWSFVKLMSTKIGKTKEVRIYNGKMTACSISGAGKTGQLCVKEWN